ncbi:MAG: A/G-specific adenine glycosylase [Opitutaceae bacterium]|nr:A/G-specific adenine glycosylase [Opitutaceae bacterium]
MPRPPKTHSSELDAAAFRRALAAWFEKHQRRLPWRTERSLYRTVVSEFMLQQTQVATVLPYFERWMRALPDFAALAAADEETVLKLWEGLGYYRRARFLHTLARELVALPAPPHTAVGWADLTGVGPYTAAAIASLAFDDAAACVDGNVVRILARLTSETRAFPDGSAAVKHFNALAGELLDPRHPGRHNEAMMELGATVCFRRKPRCTVCPVIAHCRAAREGTAEAIPAIARAAAEKREVDRVWIERDGALLLHRIPADAARMCGLHELPTAEQAGIARDALTADRLRATHRRAITRYQITERIFAAACPSDLAAAKATAARDLVWVQRDTLDSITLSGPHRRWVTALLHDRSAR